jgi:Cu/Ag efflux protein CusF
MISRGTRFFAPFFLLALAQSQVGIAADNSPHGITPTATLKATATPKPFVTATVRTTPGLGFKFTPTANPGKAVGREAAHVSTGTILAIDPSKGSVTLDHSAFADGFLQAKQSSFPIKDASLALKFKVGDKVQFALRKSSGLYRIVSMQVSDR